VTSCVIDSTNEDGYGYRLSEINVLVDDVLCGQTPETTVANESYTVTCDNHLIGTQIKLETTKSGNLLALTGITCYVYNEYKITL